MRNRLDKKVITARVCFYNINGRTYLLLSDHILAWLQINFDIVFITETHLTKGTRFSLPNFTQYHNPLSDHNDRKPHGGVSCFINNAVVPLIKRVHKDTPEVIVVEFVGGHKIFGCYIVPRDSPYSDEGDFAKIANVFSPRNCSKVVIGGGDVNSRIGDLKMKLPLNCSYRENVDKVINEYGKLLLSVCQSVSCYVVNNMNISSKIMDGNFTFMKGDRKSQNDLILSNLSGISVIKSLRIHNTIWNPSDHTPVSIEVELDITDNNHAVLASTDILTQQGLHGMKKAKKIKQEQIDWNSYKSLVENDYNSYKKDILQLRDKKDLAMLDKAVNSLSDSLYKSASTLLQPNQVKEKSTLNYDPLIVEAERVHQQWRQGDTNTDEFHSVREEMVTHLKTNVAGKERQAWLNALNEKDPKILWQKINWKGTTDNTSSKKPPLEELRKQFLKKGQSMEDSTLLCDVTGDTYVPELDDPITMEELSTVTNKNLKDKATGDGWCKKMLVNLPETILTTMLIIYNTIHSAHTYPTRWRTTVVNEVFKNKGDSEEAKNYRGISLVYLLPKVYDLILGNRFMKWFKKLCNDAQTAYQDGKSSADHVFFLRCLVQQAVRSGKKLFIIAADFDGAFDRISRSVLIRKLIRYGAGTIFVACIASMYMYTDNVIFRDKEYVTYKLLSGIKQGLPLSPLLFIFYINDIFDTYKRIHGRCVNNIYKLIHLLVHADDVTLLATLRDSAKKKLQTLSEYCSENFIVPQFTKCMFIVVNGSHEDKTPLPFSSSLLENVDYLEILGSHLVQSGSLTQELDLHMNKRFYSCIKFFNFCKENKLAPLSVRLKSLRGCVMMSLLHNCEAFGDKVPKSLESIYHKLIRAALRVRTNTPTLLLYVESGLLPIKALIEARQYKFFTRFQESLDPSGDRVIVFNELMKDPPKYLKHYCTLHEKYSNHREIYRSYDNEVKSKIRNHATKATGGTRYKTYISINPNLEESPFIECMHPFSADIVRFRLGSHSLPIEKGRWSRVEAKDRLCNVCGVVGDEHHIIYNCSLIFRDDLTLANELSCIWKQEDVFKLFGRIRNTDYL